MITEKFARFVVETHFDNIPEEGLNRTKLAAFDCLGVMLAAVTEPIGEIITGYARTRQAAPESGVIGGSFRTSAEMAALVNGTLSHALDYDDTGLSVGHPSICVVPTALALGEKLKSSGKEVAEALIIGYEVEGKLAFGCRYSHQETGIHSSALFGTIGAAATAAKLLKLDVNQTRMAFGIAASQVAGLLRNSGTMTKPLHAGNACRAGILSATLAREGFTADPDIIEVQLGYGDTYIGKGKYDESKMAATLGNPFHIVSHGIAVKKYPCCMLNHRALDALFGIIEKNKVRYEDVAGVTVGVPKNMFPLRPDASTGFEGKFCLPYNMAAALIDRQVIIDTFTDEMVKRPAVQELMKRVTLQVREDVPIYSGSTLPFRAGNPVSVKLKNGQVYENQVNTPKGSPDFPLTVKEYADKYRDCARKVLTTAQIEKSSQLALNLEKVKDISELMRLVTKKRAS
ncbi:MAG: MmgE/PrpD family protein [Dehalococcoidales bacterium]|nr:MmgE/PrpD family protein [Dehalococcoidales bacterium]